MAAAQPIKIAILAMGGEGGGVLADWIVDLGEHNGYLAQTTSVPGVAQRTGATIYYVELYPRKLAGLACRPRRARPSAVDSPRTGVMGWLQPGFHARVVDDQDVELPAGEAGEFVLRADEPFAFASGYFGMPERTVEAWRNLWFHTGDRVVREADGAFRFVDRLKDAIRRRGENISSYEVEQVLQSHPDVATVASTRCARSWRRTR